MISEERIRKLLAMGEVLARWWIAAIFCGFAFIPGFILVNVLYELTTSRLPTVVTVELLVAVLVCALLLYFLLLLAYRAFTGKGRKQDGGLLPPWAMKGMFHGIGIVGVAAAGIGLYKRDLSFVLPGALYIVMALSALNIRKPTKPKQ